MAYPLATLAPTIDATGISAPSYEDIYQSLLAIFRNIYGESVYVAGDSQDGQWIAALAKAQNDSNQAAVAVYQSLMPAFAQGAGLSSLVKLNGLRRKIPTNSTAIGTVTGQAGTIITGGVVKDTNGKLWNLPATVVVPIGGSVVVTVTAQDKGDLIAPIGTINTIYNPQLGWQSFSNTVDAVPGSPIETDAELRARQALSTAIPALSIKEAIAAAVANVTGVIQSLVYENDTSVTDANGIPGHSLSVVVDGGTAADVAGAIFSRKSPGAQTYGTTGVVCYDSQGLPTTINFFALAHVQAYFAVTIKALPGYVSTTGDAIKQALVAFVNALEIGEDVYLSQAQAAASLLTLGLGQTFYITDFRQGTAPAPTGTSTIVIAFNQSADCAVGNVGLTVT